MSTLTSSQLLTADAQALVKRRVQTVLLCWKCGKCPLSHLPRDMIRYLLQQCMTTASQMGTINDNAAHPYTPTDATFPIETVITACERYKYIELYRITPSLNKIPFTIELKRCTVHSYWRDNGKLICQATNANEMFGRLTQQLVPTFETTNEVELCEEFILYGKNEKLRFCPMFRVAKYVSFFIRRLDGSTTCVTHVTSTASWIHRSYWTATVKFYGVRGVAVLWQIVSLVEESSQ